MVTNRAVYLAIGIDCDGNKQVLGPNRARRVWAGRPFTTRRSGLAAADILANIGAHRPSVDAALLADVGPARRPPTVLVAQAAQGRAATTNPGNPE